jgi:hypothetical protein
MIPVQTNELFFPPPTRFPQTMFHPPHASLCFPTLPGLALLILAVAAGCSRQAETKPDEAATVAKESTAKESAAAEAASGERKFPARVYEFDEQKLLAARLPAEETADGWVRLFDQNTLFGWEISGEADFRVEDNTIVVDQGKQSLMCTSTSWGDFELELEFNADEGTNSGVFVRTPLEPEDPATDCYEINIAPDDNPFPTGSIVKRQQVDAEAAGPQTPGQWRTMKIRAQGRDVAVFLDGKQVCQYTDPVDLPARRIGLQHNSGRVAFRNIKIRPLGLQPMLDQELTQWTKYPEMPGEFSVTDAGELHVRGGRSQLETKQQYGDFFMLAEYKIDDPEMNSGIFFRCIPGDVMMGYECQVNNGFKDDSRLKPLDCGTGGIFRRQDARIVAGENGQWSTVLLHADGAKIAAWVEGIQVSDWEDTRPPHENPRKGKRLEPGTIMIQGHDPGTDVLFRNLKITSIK